MTFSRDNFRIDTLIPAIQTASAIVATQVLGRLGYYAIRSQTVAVLTGAAAVTAAIAHNIFSNAYAYYAALPVGLGVGIAAHKFFYSDVAVRALLNPKGVLILLAVIAAVRVIADHLPSSLKSAIPTKSPIATPVENGNGRATS